jgi:hypothetical protein
MQTLFKYLVAIFFVLQSSVGVIAAYCEHESGSAQKHMGHHTHEHAEASPDDNFEETELSADADCGGCQLASTAVVAQHQITSFHASTERSIEFSRCLEPLTTRDRPERPQWLFLA